MLARLMKYELKATSRWFLPLYAAVLFFAVINRFFISDPYQLEGIFPVKQIAASISMLLYIILIVGIMAVTLVVSIQRFYKSLLGDEGYLMFTLPVQTWKHILNKLLIAMLWNLLSGLIAFGSILILVPSGDLPEFAEVLTVIHQYIGAAGFVTIPLLVLAATAFGVLQIYAAIALGHLFNKHKLLASFGMYLAVNTVFQFLSMLMIPSIANILHKSFNNLMIPLPSDINTILIILFAASVTAGAICFILTNWLLKKRLNLE